MGSKKEEEKKEKKKKKKKSKADPKIAEIFEAVKSDPEKLAKFLEEDAKEVLEARKGGNPALLAAAAFGCCESLKLLLDAEADANVTNDVSICGASVKPS